MKIKIALTEQYAEEMRRDPQYKDYEIVVGTLQDQMNEDPELAFMLNSQKSSIPTAGHNLPSKGFYEIKTIKRHSRHDRDEPDYIAEAYYWNNNNEDAPRLDVSVRINPLANYSSISASKDEIFTGTKRKEKAIFSNFAKLIGQTILITDVKLNGSSYSISWETVR